MTSLLGVIVYRIAIAFTAKPCFSARRENVLRAKRPGRRIALLLQKPKSARWKSSGTDHELRASVAHPRKFESEVDLAESVTLSRQSTDTTDAVFVEPVANRNG